MKCPSCNKPPWIACPNPCDCPASIRKHAPTVIEEAAQLVANARADEHGDFQKNAETTATIARELGVNILPDDVPLILAALKLARHHSNAENRDNIVDAIGYLGLYARLIGIDK